MKLLIINPNTTVSMTRIIETAARQVARPGTHIKAVQPTQGPASIQGYWDIARSLAGLLDEASRHTDADATVVACFDDTGLDSLRCLMEGPVIGIGEASFHAASMISCRFSVVTTLGRSVSGLRENLAKYGLTTRCAGIRAAEVPVLALEANPDIALQRIETEIEKAIREDGAEAIVLGCSGMTSLTKTLSARFGIPVIDGITCAVTMAEAFVAAGLRTSKSGAYANDQVERQTIELQAWSAGH